MSMGTHTSILVLEKLKPENHEFKVSVLPFLCPAQASVSCFASYSSLSRECASEIFALSFP